MWENLVLSRTPPSQSEYLTRNRHSAAGGKRHRRSERLLLPHPPRSSLLLHLPSPSPLPPPSLSSCLCLSPIGSGSGLAVTPIYIRNTNTTPTRTISSGQSTPSRRLLGQSNHCSSGSDWIGSEQSGRTHSDQFPAQCRFRRSTVPVEPPSPDRELAPFLALSHTHPTQPTLKVTPDLIRRARNKML